MVFSSLEFLFIFLPVFFGIYYVVPNHMKNIVLLVGSLCFYLVGTIRHPAGFIILLISILLDFYAGILMEKFPPYKKLFFATAVCFHVLCLFTFKYAGFVISELNRLSGLDAAVSLALPIGISFYTFQGISYLVDIYKGKMNAEQWLVHFGIYISMFPQLIAGPIVTYGQVRNALHQRTIRHSAIAKGVEIFILGLGMKVLLANPLGKLWSNVKAIGFESISTPLAWMAIIAFSLQIYLDFFGYSLMAVGLGKMLGFRLPRNFVFPYLSRSMTEFWRRWHITLGTWFREYVYIPLGGNRNGKVITIRNLLIVWTLTGIWHGAGYNFLLWGCILFLIIVIEKFFLGRYLNRFPVIGHIYMVILIPLTWTVFAIEDMGQMQIFFSRLFPFFGQGAWSVFRYDYLKYLNLYYPFLIMGILFSTKWPFCILKNMKLMIRWMILAVLFAFSVYCMYRGLDDPFLYFRF